MIMDYICVHRWGWWWSVFLVFFLTLISQKIDFWISMLFFLFFSGTGSIESIHTIIKCTLVKRSWFLCWKSIQSWMWRFGRSWRRTWRRLVFVFLFLYKNHLSLIIHDDESFNPVKDFAMNGPILSIIIQIIINDDDDSFIHCDYSMIWSLFFSI